MVPAEVPYPVGSHQTRQVRIVLVVAADMNCLGFRYIDDRTSPLANTSQVVDLLAIEKE